MRKEIIASAILAILVTSIASITVLAEEVMNTEANAVKLVSYVDSKWETVGDVEVTEITPNPAGVTVRKCAIVCDPNYDLTSTTVKAHVFEIDGITKELETLHVADSGETTNCGTPSLDTGCGLYTGTFTMSVSDPEGYYTVAVWTEGQGQVSAIIKGANWVVTNKNDDGGWDWTTDSNPAAGSTTNTAGVTAMGLYYAYKLTEDPAYMDAMIDTVGYMNVTCVPSDNSDNTMTNTEKNSGCWQNKDVLFLAKLAKLTNNESIAQLAKARYDAFMSEAGNSPTGLVTFYKGYRSTLQGLVPWDVGDWVLASYELADLFPGEGYITKGNNIANALKTEVLDGGTPFFDMNDDTLPSYYLGLAGVIEAFSTTNSHTTEKNTAIANLKAGQNSDGSWPYNGDDSIPDSQTTAYAKMALDMAGGQTNMVVAAAGATWLITNQGTAGDWDDASGYLEVASEGIWAIATDISKQNRFKYNSYIALDIDATVINFGSIQAGVPKSVLGDDNFATTNKPTVKNTGNVVIDAQISGTGMTCSTNSSTPISVSDIEDQFNTHGWFALSISDRTETNLNLAPGATEKLDFKLTPPIPLAVGSYTGSVTIVAVAG